MQNTHPASQLALLLLLLLLLVPQCAFADVTRGLVLWWKLDEVGGLYAYDSSRTRAAGTLTAGPIRVASPFGPAVLLDGSDDYITGGDIAALDVGTGDFSITFWVRKDACATTGAALLAKDGWDGTGNGLLMYEPGNGFFQYWNGAADVDIGTCTSNVWTHLMITRASTNITTYQNLVQTATSTDTRTLDNAMAFVVGASAGLDHFMAAQFADIRFWNRALTTSEREEVYRSRLVPPVPVENLAFVLPAAPPASTVTIKRKVVIE